MQSLLWPEVPALFTSNFGVAANTFGTPSGTVVRRRRDGISTSGAFFRHPSSRASVPHGARRPPVVRGTP